jgi:urease accessory protein
MNLPLLQLGDSALPIGGYSHSWGLEAAIERGLVRDPPTLEHWVRSWLQHAVAPFEGVIVANVCRAALDEDWPVVHQANELVQTGLTPPTLRHASRDMGGQLLALAEAWPWANASVRKLRQLEGDGTVDWHHAVVFATLAAAARCVPEEALAVFLHQAALGAIGAGVRAIPIGHTHGQQVLARLHAELSVLPADLAGRELETAGSFGPNYEILCHAQSQLYTRLFRS